MSIDLINFIKDREGEYLSLLKKIIQLESPTNNKIAVNILVDFICEFLDNENVKVDRIKNEKYGDHIIGKFGEGDEQLLFIGHIDTVWDTGTIKRLPFRIEDGVIRGPGVYDMKGGVFQVLYAIKIIKELNLETKYKIKLLFNTDEEVGSPTSWPIIEEEAKKSKYVLVGEPGNLPNGSVKTSRKGFGIFDLKIKGISAHAGADPDKGASTIHEFAKQILYLESLANPGLGTTINVGTVSGGTRTNVIADKLRATIDLRVNTLEEAERVVPLIQNLRPTNPKINLKVEGNLNRPPLERNERNLSLYNLVKKQAAALGMDLPETNSGGVSDGNITSAIGVPTLCGLGVVGHGAHSDNEYCLNEYIPQRIALMIKIFTKL